MRILQLVHQYPPEYVGGVELNTQLLSAGLVARGHEVFVFYRGSGEGVEIKSWQSESGVHVFAAIAGLVEPTGRFFATFRTHRLHRLFERVLAEVQPDIVHVQHLMGLPVSLVDLLIEQTVPFVITLHDYWWGCANAQLLTNDTEEVCEGPRLWLNCGRCALARAGKQHMRWLAPGLVPLFAYRHRLLSRILTEAQAITVPTAFTREIYAQMGVVDASKIKIVPNGIRVNKQTKPSQPPKTFSLPLRIAYVGGIARQKGVDVLVKAICNLPADEVQLSVYGDTEAFPDYVAELQQMAGEPVHFEGRLPNEKLLEHLAQADLLIVPSIWYETAAIVIQEAFSVGLPVIASDLGALRDRVRHDVDGFRFPAGDWKALREILQRFVKEPTLLERLRANIQMNDTIEHQVEEIEKIYQRATI